MVEGGRGHGAARGVGRTTLDEILAHTDAGKSQLFHYFPGGKHELVAAIAAFQGARVLDAQRPHIDRLDTWASWHAWHDAVLTHYRSLPELACPISVLANDLLASIIRQERPCRGVHARLAAAPRSRCGPDDRQRPPPAHHRRARRMAEMIFAALQGGLVLMQSRRDLEPLEAWSRRCTPLAALGRGPGARQTADMGAIVDLSHPIHDGLVTYPGLPGPVSTDHLSRAALAGRYAPGVEFHIGRIEMVANTGTYLDTPFHRFADGHDLAGLDLARSAACPAWSSTPDRRPSTAALPARRRRRRPRRAGPHRLGPALGHRRATATPATRTSATAAVDRLVAGGAALVGIDSVNIDDTATGERPVHTGLLGAGIPIVEHLRGLDRLAGDRSSRSPPCRRPIVGLGTFPVRALAQLGGEPYADVSMADWMSAATSSGCEVIATWLDATSTTVAPMRWANSRSASAGMASSLLGDQVPRRQGLPCRDAHHVAERPAGQRLLHGPHHVGVDRVDVGGEVLDEVVLGQPGEALSVDAQVGQCGRRRTLREQRADRLALVETERGDVHQRDDVRRVRPERGA